jgi:gliding motility-associated-like protein
MVLDMPSAKAQTTANDDFESLLEDGITTVPVLLNDVLFGPLPFTVTIETPPAHGDATLVAGNSIAYQPEPDFFGTDSVRYTVCDGGEPIPACDNAWLVLTVLPVNDAPLARRDTLVAFSGLENDLDVLANDLDVDGDALRIAEWTTPLHGLAEAVEDSTLLRYRPNTGYLGPDSIRYRACDPDGLCAEAWVLLDVQIGNLPPIALDDALLTIVNQGRQVNLLSNDSDPEGMALTQPEILMGPFHGSVSSGLDGRINYAPDLDFVGADSLRYEVCDTDSLPRCAEASLRIRVEELELPDSFSPNADGQLDIYTVDGLEAWPDHRLTIFDRRGAVVWDAAPYGNDWRGEDQGTGRQLPDDVYVYRFRLPELGLEFSGTITLLR